MTPRSPRFVTAAAAATAAMLGLLLLLPSAWAVTLEEARKNPKQYILYEEAPFNIGMHVGLAMLVTYGALTFLVIFIAVVSKLVQKRSKRQ
ncbi:unnamed protein product [Protopolystoma xenopodis]|uniref:Uncharacterized protein n=1 Tax=Protopolystoma xenopodis TaxID=117903 RepID=A0A448X4N9_9PLAT|nr:unnamed protein product [Protopolystoma xenopodis]